MVEPLTLAGTTATQVQKLLKLLPEESGKPKFGYAGNPEKEKLCPFIDVFMKSVGRTSATNEYRRERMKPTDTPMDARDAFSKESSWGTVSQEDIADENDFVFSKSMLNEPLYSFSCNCKLNLKFTHRHSVITDGVSGVGQAVYPSKWWGSIKGSKAVENEEPSSKL